MSKIIQTSTVGPSAGLLDENGRKHDLGVRSLARSLPREFSGFFFHLCGTAFGVDSGSFNENFVTYFSGIQLTPGVYCHTGATA